MSNLINPTFKATNQVTNKFMFYHARDHLKYPVPRPLELKTVGHTLSEYEWKKLCKKYLIPTKLDRYCDRKKDGTLLFFGEGGIDAASVLQQKSHRVFRFIMYATTREAIEIGLALSLETGLQILEVSFRQEFNSIRNINDQKLLKALTLHGQDIMNLANVQLA